MKICSKTSIVTVPALVAAGLVTALSSVLFSCKKEPGVGDGIRFRASAYGPSGSPSTKTVYGSIDNKSQTYQMLNWVEGDRVRIYSPQAGLQEDATNHFDDCVVDGVSTDGNISVATVSSTHGNGLVWGEANPHYFYAVYPSPAVNSDVSITAGAGSNAVTVRGTIPATQTLSWSGVLGTPDMRYAYMYASTTSAPNSQVDLQFRPMFTAFQFEIGPGEYTSIHLTGFTLSTTDATSPLSGTFTISGVAGSENLTCPTSGTGVSTSLSVSMDATLTTGNTLILTVFALPIDLGQLSISFTGDEIGTRSLALKQGGVYISFDACKKYRIYGLSFPKGIDIEGEGEDINWDGNIDVTSGGETVTWVSSIVGEGTSDGAITWDYPGGTVPGEFSVSASQKVYFASGNLRWTGSAFEIASTQYYYSTTTNGRVNSTSGNEMNVFPYWKRTETTSMGDMTSSANTRYVPSGGITGTLTAAEDWGNCVSKTGDNAWRTPTKDEWVYLLNTRTAGGTVNGTASARYTEATINTDGASVNGVIIFPDGVDFAAGEATWGRINGTSSWGTKCTSDQWTALEAKGCVFLPAAGCVYDNVGWYVMGGYGLYWSSTGKDIDFVYGLQFYNGGTIFMPDGDDGRSRSASIRLVQNK